MRHFPVSFSLIVVSVLGVYKWRFSSVPSGMVWLSIHSHWGKPHLLSVLPIAGLTSFFSHIGKFLISPKQSVNPGHNSPLASSIKISANGTHGDTELHTSSLWNSEGSLYTPCPYVKNAVLLMCAGMTWGTVVTFCGLAMATEPGGGGTWPQLGPVGLGGRIFQSESLP